MKKLLLLSFCSTLFFSCAKKTVPTATAATPAPQKAVVTTPTIEKTDPTPSASDKIATDEAMKINKVLIENGQRVFETNCNKCHSLKVPANYTQENWVKLVDWMAPKAQLSEKEKKECLAYLKYNAKDAPVK